MELFSFGQSVKSVGVSLRAVLNSKFSISLFVVLAGVAAKASGPVPKYGEALCHYQDMAAAAQFEFYIANYQNTYDFKKIKDATYYVTVVPEQELLIVSVTPLDSDGQVDTSKASIGRGFNTITRDGFVESSGSQWLSCDPI